MIKKVLKAVLIYLAYVFLTYSRIEDNLPPDSRFYFFHG